jgi:hypothetical protein
MINFFANKMEEEDNDKNINLLPFSYKNDHFLCKICKKAPKLQIDEINKKFIVQCHQNDNEKKLLEIQNLKEDYIVEDDDNDDNEILQCQEHLKNFKDYCQFCKKNYCEECQRCNHQKLNIDNKNIQNHIKQLENIFFPNMNGVGSEENEVRVVSITKEKNTYSDLELLKIIVSIIINDYLRVKNYHLDISIQNLSNYYKNHPLPNSQNVKTEFCINSPQELIDSKEITKIEIYQYCFDLNKLNVALPNLIVLSLKNNNIFDVKILINCNFKNLEELYLDINKIDDNILTYMKDMKFKKLKVFSLKQNYLTDYRVFEEVKVFQNLKKFDISSNRLFKNKEFFENKIIDLNNIEELILSNGVFDENSIKYISSLNVQYLKSLDLSCNNLSSLNFILNSNWPNLENLILNENDISKLSDLITQFKDIEHNLLIMLENNLIKDEQEIDDLIKSNSRISIKYKLNNEIIDDKNNDNEQNNTSTGVSY